MPIIPKANARDPNKRLVALRYGKHETDDEDYKAMKTARDRSVETAAEMVAYLEKRQAEGIDIETAFVYPCRVSPTIIGVILTGPATPALDFIAKHKTKD